MNTRRSPRNQARLFTALFKLPSLTKTINEARECVETLTRLHDTHYPECEGGCPASSYLHALSTAIRQATAPRPRWNADLAGDLERAIKDARMEIEQFPAL